MDVTELDRVRNLLGVQTDETQVNTALLRLIETYSNLAERYCNRHFLQTSRTEKFRIVPGQERIHVKGVPISSVTEIKNDSSRDFGASSVVDADNYSAEDPDDIGVIYFDVPLSWGPAALQITYTGGLAADTTTLIANYPELSRAVEMQIAFVYSERHNYGLQTLTTGDQTWTLNPPGKWIRESQEILNEFRLGRF